MRARWQGWPRWLRVVSGAGLAIVACFCGLIALAVVTPTEEAGPTEDAGRLGAVTVATATRQSPTATSKPPTGTPPPPTATHPPPTATSVPPTATSVPPAAPVPTQKPAEPAPAKVVIAAVNKSKEYVDLRNDGGVAQDLTGWKLVSEKGNQVCPLGGRIDPGQTLRVWALAANADQGGFNCGFGDNIWNNSESDPAVLYDASGREVARR